MADVLCYLIEETDQAQVYLRRYAHSSSGACPGPSGYHSSRNLIGETSVKREATSPSERLHRVYEGQEDSRPNDADPRWPLKCDACDYVFDKKDQWQVFYEVIYLNPLTGVAKPLLEWEPGAIFEAWWAPDWMRGFDGKSYICRLPDRHDWCIDSEANNCTKKGDRSHRCWLRHGEPPNFTVDKEPAHLTCAAGGGSIQSSGYHGFLRNGRLTHA